MRFLLRNDMAGTNSKVLDKQITESIIYLIKLTYPGDIQIIAGEKKEFMQIVSSYL